MHEKEMIASKLSNYRGAIGAPDNAFKDIELAMYNILDAISEDTNKPSRQPNKPLYIASTMVRVLNMISKASASAQLEKAQTANISAIKNQS